MAATEKLDSLLKTDSKSDASWRTDCRNFNSGARLPEGYVNLSPAWFQQGHEVSVSALVSAYDIRQLTLNEKASDPFPEVGKDLKSAAGSEWLNCMLESNAVLSAILAVIHPALYNAGRHTFNCLRKATEIQPQNVLSRWTSVFNGVAVICNRKTLLHRDGYSRFAWYELLTTFGNYTDCKLELPGLGVTLEYGPGTVVGFSGMLLQHAVPSFKGERVCYAYFMRGSVQKWAKASGYPWMNTNYYEKNTQHGI
jgi:hypothetical protein